MGNLEELLYETCYRINYLGSSCSEEQEEEIRQNLKEIERRLQDELYDYGVHIPGKIEDKFYEMTSMMKNINRATIEEIAVASTQKVRSDGLLMKETLEEERMEEEEQASFVDRSFYLMDNGVEAEKEDHRKVGQIEDYLREAYQDIIRDVNVNIAMQYGRRNSFDKEEIQNVIVRSFKQCVSDMTEKHDVNRNEITRRIQDQIQSLHQEVTATIDKEEEKCIQNSLDYVKLSGKELDEFNRKSREFAEKARNSSEKEKASPEILEALGEAKTGVTALSTDEIC